MSGEKGDGTRTEEDFILDSISALVVEMRDFILESLPLGFCMIGIKLGVRVIRLLYQAEIRRCLNTISTCFHPRFEELT